MFCLILRRIIFSREPPPPSQALLEVNCKHGAKVVISISDGEATREIYRPFKLHEITVQRSVSTDKDNRQKAKEVIGVLPVCDCCGRYSGNCPDCGVVMGDANYSAMVAASVFDDQEAF